MANGKIESGYSVETLKRGIEAANKNIATFEKAIEAEYATIKEYRRMMAIIAERASRPKEIVIEVERESDVD